MGRVLLYSDLGATRLPANLGRYFLEKGIKGTHSKKKLISYVRKEII